MFQDTGHVYIDMINSGSTAYASGSIFTGWSLGREGESGTGAGDLSGISKYYLEIYGSGSSTKHYLNMDINIDGGADVYFDYTETSEGNWTLTCGVDERGISLFNSSPYICDQTSLTVKNSFGAGTLYYDGIEFPTTSSTGVTYYLMNSSTTLNIETQSPQTYPSINGTTYYFKNWNNDANYLQTSEDVTIASDLTFVAIFYYYSNIGLFTSFEGSNGNGHFLVNDTTINTYSGVSKRSDYQLTFTSQDQENTNTSMYYTFDCWKKDGSVFSTSSTCQFYPDADANYTLNMKPVKPTNTYRNFYFKSQNTDYPIIGQAISFKWRRHPDSRVDYQIWRRVKHNGNLGSPVLRTTKNNGDTTYVDYDYAYTDGYTDDMINYDVRARLNYQSNYSYADDAYEIAFAKEFAKIVEDNQVAVIANELPTEYSMGNYPNPFNPTTIINYTLPENGFVTIKIYDLLGKEVATLVNENKSAGYHNINFDASRLTSGIYIYTINAGNPSAGSERGFVQSKKMILVK